MTLLKGNNIEELQKLDNNSVDSIVTDPPYGLRFMNKKWDHDVPSVEFWRECLRVLKPGGHVLSFGGTRTYHRMVVNIEDAGFEIRDQIMWLYGSGFPKSYNVSKGIDKKLGQPRGTTYEPNTGLAKKWDGFGTALKPANEPIVLARKPLSEKTIVDNVLRWGTGALNIDGCRVELDGEKPPTGSGNPSKNSKFAQVSNSQGNGGNVSSQGRFPANIILDEEAGKALDEQSGQLGKSSGGNSTNVGNKVYGKYEAGLDKKVCGFGDSGGASRFFYCAKASKSERNAGLEHMAEKNTWTDTRKANSNDIMTMKRVNPKTGVLEDRKEVTKSANHHPTVKPIKLMQYLVRLVTPPEGTVLDPFMGSGSTGVACHKENFNFIGIELEPEYFNIAQKRIKVFSASADRLCNKEEV